MKRPASRLTVLAVLLSVVSGLRAEPAADGALTGEFLQRLRDGYELSGEDRARFNAITNNGLAELALDRSLVQGEDGHFSHRIKSRGITDQQSSGRCWMFAGFNVMRPKVIHEVGLEGFEFSAAYLLFWDKMEKANLYLEEVIELRNADRLDREWQLVNEWMIGDGGWWNYVTALITKYGVVPAEVMPETHGSNNTRGMNRVLERLLRSRAADLLEASEAGADVAELRRRKEAAMAEIYRFLVLNLGEPPEEFEWRYEKKRKRDGENGEDGEDGPPAVAEERLSERRTYTPQGFYREFVGVDLSKFVALYHDPTQETGRHFRFARARNIAGAPEMSFANVGIGELKKAALASILANQPLWFAANVSVDQSREHGIMAEGLYDYESLFGIEMPFSRTDRARFHAGASNHAMVFMGVDLRDGKPHKWLVENSWGTDEGSEGMWTLYDGWFDEHVYVVIVHRDHVTPETLAVFGQEAETLPAWYPGAEGIRDKR